MAVGRKLRGDDDLGVERDRMLTTMGLLMAMAALAQTAATDRCCAFVELRQYTLKPGQRDTLIELFEREFVETQEAVGARVIGQFRDRDRPDRFVWLRGFSDMDARKQSLETFYGGPTWRAHREAANATMLDSDNVLLLRPVGDAGGFAWPLPPRQPVGTGGPTASRIVATLWYRAAPLDDAFLQFFGREAVPVLTATGAPPLATFATADVDNTFPALPVRTGEHVFVWFARFADDAAWQRHREALAASERWRDAVLPVLQRGQAAPEERLVLAPAARSALR